MIRSLPSETEESEEGSTSTDGTPFFNLFICLFLYTLCAFQIVPALCVVVCHFWCCLRLENSVGAPKSWLALFTRTSAQAQRLKTTVSECGPQTGQAGARSRDRHVLQERPHSVDVAT